MAYDFRHLYLYMTIRQVNELYSEHVIRNIKQSY
jgi:hypothetical protein